MYSGFLKNVWYVALPSHELIGQKPQARKIMNEPIVFYRDSHGKVAAMRDICPHRGIPLSYDNDTLKADLQGHVTTAMGRRIQWDVQ